MRVSIKYPTVDDFEKAGRKPCGPSKATHIALGNDKYRCAALIIERMAGGYVLQDRNGRTCFVEHDTLEFLAMDFYEWEWRELPTAVGSVVTDQFDVPYVLEESGEWISRRLLHGEASISVRRLESWAFMILHDAGAEKEEGK